MKCKMIIIVLSLVAIAFLSGCEKKGPAEKVGEQIDEGIEKVQEKAEDATEEIEDAADDVKKSVTE